MAARPCLRCGTLTRVGSYCPPHVPAHRSSRQTPGRSGGRLRTLLDVAECDGARSAALVCLLALNGLRASEAVAAAVENLGFERGHQTLCIVRKGGKVATVPLALRTAAAVALLIGDREQGPIFATRTGRPLDRHAAWKIIRRLARSAGLR